MGEVGAKRSRDAFHALSIYISQARDALCVNGDSKRSATVVQRASSIDFSRVAPLVGAGTRNTGVFAARALPIAWCVDALCVEGATASSARVASRAYMIKPFTASGIRLGVVFVVRATQRSAHVASLAMWTNFMGVASAATVVTRNLAGSA